MVRHIVRNHHATMVSRECRYVLKATDKMFGLPVPYEVLVGGSVPMVAVFMWFSIHKSKNTLLLMHGGKAGNGKAA